MKRDVALDLLYRRAPEIRGLGVDHLYLFGSTARDEAHAASDVDLFFDYSDPKFSLFDVMAVQDKLHEILQVRADVMSRESLHPLLRSAIEQSALQVF